MASIKPYGNGWRAQVKLRSGRDSATFRTKREASAWALEREAELSGAKLPTKSFGDAMRRYANDVSPTHKGERWESVRLRRLADTALGAIPFLGDVFDWFYRSNSKNLRMIKRHLDAHHPASALVQVRPA